MTIGLLRLWYNEQWTKKHIHSNTFRHETYEHNFAPAHNIQLTNEVMSWSPTWHTTSRFDTQQKHEKKDLVKNQNYETMQRTAVT